MGTYERIGTSGSHLGQLLLYQESDSIALFHLDVTRSAPSYNSGSLTGRIGITTEQFSLKSFNDELDCEIKLTLLEESLSLTTIKDDCGFGAYVLADGVFKLQSNEQPELFITGEGDTVRFEDFLDRR